MVHVKLFSFKYWGRTNEPKRIQTFMEMVFETLMFLLDQEFSLRGITVNDVGSNCTATLCRLCKLMMCIISQ